MTLPVDHIHNLDSYITNEGEAFESVADSELVSMDLWVPSECVAVHTIDAPSAPRRKWEELIPWILEDRLLQPIEDMHFVVSGQTPEGQLQILVVSQLEMQHWQRIAKNSGVVAKSMYPDYMALPYEADRISVGWRDGVCLVRYGVIDGFAASAEMAWPLVQSLLDDDSSLKVSLSIPSDLSVPESITDRADINDSEVDWQFSALPSQCNLLTGEFKSAVSSASLLKWLPTAGLGVLTILLAAMYLQVASANILGQISLVENRLTQNYSRLFQGKRPAVSDVKIEAEKKLSDLMSQRISLNTEPVASLMAVEKLMTGCGCQLKGLQYEKEALVIQIQNGSALKKRNLNIPGYKVAVTQMPGDDENAIELRLSPRNLEAAQ
jgi:type II secretion system protein L